MNIGLLISATTLIVAFFIGGFTLTYYKYQPWNYILWGLAGILFVVSLICYFIQKNKKIKTGVKVFVNSAYQPDNAKKKDRYINLDIEFSIRIERVPTTIAKIQLMAINKQVEINSPKTPIVQETELESYVANLDLDYYLYLKSVSMNLEDQYFLCVLAGGVKHISNKFSFGNSSTLLLRNKPNDFNLVIK